MQNIQNLFGFQAAPGLVQPGQAPMQQQQPQHQQMVQPNRPRKEAAVPPILNPQATAKDLYCVESAVMKEYDPAKQEWAQSTIKVQIERKPFAEGGMRCAYRMKIVEGIEVHGMDRIYVLKLSKDPKENMRQYYKDVETQMEARKWAQEFNKSGAPKQVNFIEAMVIILTDRPTKPTCTMEKYVEGEYVKYNDNWAWCDDKRNTPQAFSHWSWEASGNKVLICDLQGVGDCWTDPQIHTIDGRGFGKGNAGLQGIRQFLHKHKCNAICRALRLQSVTGRVKAQDEGTKWGAQLQRKRAHTDNIGPQAHAPSDRSAAPPPQAGPDAPVGVGLTIDGGMAQGILLPLIVVSVKPNSPAALSGKVKRGDFVIQVDDCPVQGASVADVKKLIRGAPGTPVTIYLQRGVKTVTVELLRPAVGATASKRRRLTPEKASPVLAPGEKTAHQVFQEVINGHGKDTDSDTVPFKAMGREQAMDAVPPKHGRAKMLPQPPPHEAAHEDVQQNLRRKQQQRQEILRKLERFPQATAGDAPDGSEQRIDKENMRNHQPAAVPDLFGMIAKNMALQPREPAEPPANNNAPPFFL